MTALTRKLLRDLLRTRGQAMAVALVLACGISTLVMSLTALRSLTVTMEQTYDRSRFAHVFASVTRAPRTLLPRIADIPGVAQAEARLVTEVMLDMPFVREPVTARVISIPESRPPTLNEPHLRRGRWIESGRRSEVLVSEAFAKAHGLEPGSELRAMINGRARLLSVTGIALSPEFIYEIREGEMLPDPLRFGVLFMAEPELAAALDLTGAFNNVAVTLLPGASEAEVIRRLDILTAPYGGTGAYGRDDQTSHRFLDGELEQLRAMALIAPLIFFAVAVFLLHMVLSRQIAVQREQIAALKAFGYTRGEIGGHYLSYTLLIALAGVIIGSGTGIWLGHLLTGLYARFFRFPEFSFVVDLRIILPTAAVTLLITALGASLSVLRAVRLPPAEAMRPEPPARYRPTIIERLGLQHGFTQPARMVIRHVERRPARSLMTVLGIALAASVMVVGTFTRDVIEHVIDEEFAFVQGQDITVFFSEPVSGRAHSSLSAIPGVTLVEGFRAMPAVLRFEHRHRRVAITALAPEQTLLRPLDRAGRPVALPEHGILLSENLADHLGVEPGDVVTTEILEGMRPVAHLRVAGIIRQATGLSAWISLPEARRIMREQDRISAVHARVESDRMNNVFAELKRTPAVGGVMVKQTAVKSFRETIAENMRTMRLFNTLFATIITFGVVYNAARITMAERSRELATLRVIGFTRGEVSLILIGELLLLALLAIPIGLLLGRYFSGGVMRAMEMQDYRFPLVIEPATYAMAAIVVLGAAVCSALIVRRRVDQLDLVAVLKAGD